MHETGFDPKDPSLLEQWTGTNAVYIVCEDYRKESDPDRSNQDSPPDTHLLAISHRIRPKLYMSAMM